jgi:hypothetical protein
LVEDANGRMEIVHWTDNTAHVPVLQDQRMTVKAPV